MTKINIELDIDLAELAKEVMLNMPEYSISFTCLKWNYDQGIYKFQDFEDGQNPNKIYTVKLKDIEKALPIFIKGLGTKWSFYGLSWANVSDPANWDAESTDGLVQLAIFGEIVYG